MNIYDLQNNLYKIYSSATLDLVNDMDDFLDHNHDFILSLDWSGEDYKNQLEDYIYSFYTLLSGNKLPSEALELWEKENKETTFKRGEYILKKIVLVGQILSGFNIELCLINNNSDQYHIFLIPHKDYNKFSKMKGESWFIESFRDLTYSDMGDNIQYIENKNTPNLQRWFISLPFSDKLAFIVTFVMIVLLIYLKL